MLSGIITERAEEVEGAQEREGGEGRGGSRRQRRGEREHRETSGENRSAKIIECQG